MSCKFVKNTQEKKKKKRSESHSSLQVPAQGSLIVTLQTQPELPGREISDTTATAISGLSAPFLMESLQTPSEDGP